MGFSSSKKEFTPVEGIGIWGNEKCAQCGACCLEYYEFLYSIGEAKTKRCEHLVFEGEKAFCKIHKKKPLLCKGFFCGDVDMLARVRLKRDESLRNTAFMKKTATKQENYCKLT